VVKIDQEVRARPEKEARVRGIFLARPEKETLICSQGFLSISSQVAAAKRDFVPRKETMRAFAAEFTFQGVPPWVSSLVSKLALQEQVWRLLFS